MSCVFLSHKKQDFSENSYQHFDFPTVEKIKEGEKDMLTSYYRVWSETAKDCERICKEKSENKPSVCRYYCWLFYFCIYMS